MPIQKIKFPNPSLPFRYLVLLNHTNGIWLICINKRYPLNFLNSTNINSSCTKAESRNVIRVATGREMVKLESEEW